MAETPKAQSSAFRQDLLRGIRWGTILLIAMLLSIAAYRVLSSSPAAASQPKAAEQLAPAPAVTTAPDTAIQVGDAVLKGPDAPPAPELPKVRKSSAKAVTPPVVEPPLRLQAPRFAPLPVAAIPKPTANAFVAAPIPEASPTPAPVAETPVSATVLVPAPPSPAAEPDNSKQGNRATRAVRSVGRLFRFGRKDDPAKPETEKK